MPTRIRTGWGFHPTNGSASSSRSATPTIAANGHGELLRIAERPADAIDQHRQALALADSAHSLDEQARAHDGIAQSALALGDTATAIYHWHRPSPSTPLSTFPNDTACERGW